MSFNVALNVAWALMGAAALGTFAFLESRSKLVRGKAPWAYRSFCVLLAVVLLFPCVSASDDLLWFQAIPLGTEGRGSAGAPFSSKSDEKATLHLARLLEALGNFQIASIYSLAVTLCFCAFLSSPASPSWRRYSPSSVSRAPPAATPAS